MFCSQITCLVGTWTWNLECQATTVAFLWGVFVSIFMLLLMSHERHHNSTLIGVSVSSFLFKNVNGNRIRNIYSKEMSHSVHAFAAVKRPFHDLCSV